MNPSSIAALGRSAVLSLAALAMLTTLVSCKRDAPAPPVAEATFFSRIRVPIGNTGGANVSVFRPMPVPEDLNSVLSEIV